MRLLFGTQKNKLGVDFCCVYPRWNTSYLLDILGLLGRSPRWTSGSPRMLLVLVREFESRRGEILNLFANKKEDKKQGSTAESAQRG